MLLKGIIYNGNAKCIYGFVIENIVQTKLVRNL